MAPPQMNTVATGIRALSRLANARSCSSDGIEIRMPIHISRVGWSPAAFTHSRSAAVPESPSNSRSTMVTLARVCSATAAR